MTVAYWSSRYETGFKTIDDQHKGLFEALNRLSDSFITNSSASEIRACMNFLVDYIIRHFQAEEELMKMMDYPMFMSHVGHHGHLFAQVKRFQTKLNEDQLITIDVAILLADWLKHHISDMDLDFARFASLRHASDQQS